MVGEQVIANKIKLGPEDALGLAGKVNQIFVAKGKKLLRFNMRKEPPSEMELLKALLGPSGRLRAPTIRKGKTLLVGFNEEAYRIVFP